MLRKELGAWLRRLNASDHETFDILLASGEALANAVEHPLERRMNMVMFSAVEWEGNVLMTVRDFGHWPTVGEQPDRGWGLQLMRALMDWVEIAKSDSGTTVTLCRFLDGRP
jgi:anti-sigma regulatory factor (Ser/Thr protein kinase)